MELAAANELAMKKDASRVGAVYWKIEGEKIALDKEITSADYKTTEMGKKYEMSNQKVAQELENYFEKAKAELAKKNVDMNTLKFEAFENVVDMFHNKKFDAQMTKVNPDDIVSNMAKSWFDQKTASG